MANITPKQGKDGKIISYRIKVAGKRDAVTGKQKSYSKTWAVPDGWSKKAVERELKKVVAQFEVDCNEGRIVTKKEAKEKQIEEAKEKEKSPTVSQYIQVYLAHCQVTKKPTTVIAYSTKLNIFAKYYGSKKMKEITIQDIQTFMDNRIVQGNSHRTLKGYFTALKIFFKFAEENCISENPMSVMKPPQVTIKDKEAKKKKAESKALSEQETKIFLEAIKLEPLMWECFFVFMLDSGCRVGEVVGLKWENIDIETGVVEIKQQIQYIRGRGKIEQSPKSFSSIRTIQLNSYPLELLRQWKKESMNDEIVFYSIHQSYLNQSNIYRRLKSICKKNGLRENISCHSLRHTMATIALMNGADITNVSGKIGHKKVSTTLDIYSHASLIGQQRVNDILSKALYKDKIDSKMMN